MENLSLTNSHRVKLFKTIPVKKWKMGISEKKIYLLRSHSNNTHHTRSQQSQSLAFQKFDFKAFGDKQTCNRARRLNLKRHFLVHFTVQSPLITKKRK